MKPLETYLQELRAIRSSGAAVKETSYYPPLASLLSEIGKKLKPKVKCIIHLQDTGAGIPDGGLFTEDQIQSAVTDLARGAIPARGAIEAKPTAADAWRIAETRQVKDYWKRYRQVLVTNYRDFLLVGADPDGNCAVLETYRLASDEQEFWRKAAHPRSLAEEHAEGFEEFLKRAMLYPAPLATPRDLAWFLAPCAREAKIRIETGELPALAGIRSALEEALGLKFEGARGDHFFRSTLVQTLFYGVFSAWVLWSRSHRPTDRTTRFEWRMSAHYLRVPILRKLFHEVAEPGQLETMNLPEVLDWAGAALNRVDRASFFATFEEGHAVQYFYEPFLEAFDPGLRKDLGVWYTPVEVVKYMVARVDTELRSTLGLSDGLADPNVYVLDPCCGTGAYLVEVLRKIAETLHEKRGDALVGHDLKRAALERVFGFEILPAPFVVSHLQLGLLLQSFGAPLSNHKKERAGVFLTNALTGWEPPKKPKKLPFVELEEERHAADEVKRERPILVILGNPPYNSFAGIAKMEEERGLTEAYRTTKAAPVPQGQGLNDLYVRFFRMAERRIVEKSGRGIVSFISNYSWLDGLSFTGMRERYLEVFDQIWVDCLNGDKYKTGKLTPEGEPDPSIFSTQFNREGIQVGTAIALLVRTSPSTGTSGVRFRHLWGKEKRARLLETAVQDGVSLYERLEPPLSLGLPFAPVEVQSAYLSWPLLPDLFPVSFPGVKTSRDDVVVDIDRERLVERMEKYFDPYVSNDQLSQLAPGAVTSSSGFNALETRSHLVKRGFLPKNVVRYCYRPFDIRWLYWEPETRLLDRNRSEYMPHVFKGNLWIEGRQKQPMEDFDRGYVVKHLADNFGNGLSSFFPLYLKRDSPLLKADSPRPNISDRAAAYLAEVQATEQDLFHHAVAVLQAPSFRAENRGALRQDWPRTPLPASRESLLASADLGRRIVELLDPESAVKGITTSQIRAELRAIGSIRGGSGRLDPEGGDLDVTAGWGHAGKGGITMPARGKLVERPYDPQERGAIEQGCAALGLTADEATALLGDTTLDVYLNEKAYWKNVPVRVWEYTIGGYQVIKKWLSYREKKLLGPPPGISSSPTGENSLSYREKKLVGRSLTVEEARYVTEMARRIAALLLLTPELDANYEAVKRAAWAWSSNTHLSR